MNEDKFEMTSKILQVNLEDSGGAFSLMFQLQKQLNGKVIFDYYAMGGFKSKTISDAIKSMGGLIYEANLRNNRLVGSILLPFYFYRFIKNRNYKCIHIHSDTAWKLMAYAYPAKKAGIKKIIVHSHSTDVNGDFRGFKKLCHYLARNVLPRYADIFLTCSDKATEWMFPKIKKEKIIWIKNGIDTNRFRFNAVNREQIREKLKIMENIIVVGVIGDMSYQKNPKYIVDVLERLLKVNRNYRLLFVGDGKSRRNVEKYIYEKMLDKYVIFYGRTCEIENVLSALDIFVMPSRFEGLPVSAIEAQASGLPCVISSKVSRQTAIIDRCKFVDVVDESINTWVKLIMDSCRFANRNQAYILVRKAGFDIKTTALVMEKIYGET